MGCKETEGGIGHFQRPWCGEVQRVWAVEKHRNRGGRQVWQESQGRSAQLRTNPDGAKDQRTWPHRDAFIYPLCYNLGTRKPSVQILLNARALFT